MAKIEKHSHYKKPVKGFDFIDPYRVCLLFEVGGGPIEHAIKKLLVAGKRGAKDKAKDVQEAIDSLVRWQHMQEEDKNLLCEEPNVEISDMGKGTFLGKFLASA